MIVPRFSSPELERLEDQAVLDLPPGKLAFSTDTFVVNPIFFPGGDIGDLAINGTVNDIAMCGGNPQYLSVGLIIEEGFAVAELERIITEMGAAADRAGVTVVTGDTKVVPRGAVDKIFINTSGIGVIEKKINVASHRAAVGDRIILSGSMAATRT